MPITTDGPLLEPENKGIDEFHVGLGTSLRASAAQAFEDSPVMQLLGIGEMHKASGKPQPDFGAISSGIATRPELSEETAPALPNIDMIDANDRVKKAGLASHLKLPDQPDIPPAQLAIMMERAQRRQELDATIDRGPQGFIPSALSVGTSFAVGAVDPLNLASAFIPVVGELRYGKILAGAGESLAARLGARAMVGAAEGMVGQAALEPLDWWSHTQDGRDFGMSDVLHNLMFGAALGGGLRGGGGFISDAYRGRQQRPLYPFAPGEAFDRNVPPAAPEAAAAPPAPDLSDTSRRIDEILAATSEPPSPAVATINDLPQRAHEDAMRGAIADLIEGEPVKAGEMLEAAARADPRIAESLDAHGRGEQLSATTAREAVFDDVQDQLRAAGLGEDEASFNAAIVAARYATRAERLGNGLNAANLYHGEGLEVRAGAFADAEGRVYQQRRGEGDLFAQREADGQMGLPGTERVGQGELAQRRADAPLKPGVAQKPMDEGLFGDDAKQKSFFQSRPTAPPFYSAVDRAVTSAKQDKATPEQWLGTLKNAAGVKPEEMKWLGLEDWLKEQEGSVSKAQVQDYVRANAIEVKEVNKGRIPLAEMDQLERRAAQADAAAEAINVRMMEKYGDLSQAFEKWSEAERSEFDRVHGEAAAAGVALSERNQDHADGLTSRGNDAKYPSYTLPGGENYRELLLTLPPKFGVKDLPAGWRVEPTPHSTGDSFRVTEQGSDVPLGYGHTPDIAAQQALAENRINPKAQEFFASSHWEEPNVLAHIRFDDRISDGKKTLHVAEVQSDWHQAGKRRGYRDEEKPIDRSEIERKMQAITDAAPSDLTGRYLLEWQERQPEYVRLRDEFNSQAPRQVDAVPDAPFKTTWPELSMKRMIRYAAENGYERISWDTGATNAERYDLSKQVTRLYFQKNKDGTFDLNADTSHGEGASLGSAIPENKLSDYVGKDVADRIVKKLGTRSDGEGSLEGIDLKVGGEGMAGFYDKIMPATVNKLVKKFGAKVEERKIAGPDAMERFEIRDATDQGGRELIDAFPTRGEAEAYARDFDGGVEVVERQIGDVPVHALDITPELRSAAVDQGFPLFQGGAEGPRGRITLAENRAIVDLFKDADRSTFMHESGHLWLDELMRDAEHADAGEQLRADRKTVLDWLGVKDASEIGTAQHEQWAEGFERYLATGNAPSNALVKAFEQFKQWLAEIYRAIAGHQQEVSAEVRAVMDRLLATDAEIAARRAEQQDVARAVTRHVAPKRATGRAAADPETWSLFEYLASKGGLRPDPELKAIFGTERGPFVPGFGALVRKNGMPLDEALRSAKDGRYFFDEGDVSGVEARLTPRDLLDRIDDENRKRKVYRTDRMPEEKGLDRDHEAHQITAALHDELESALGQRGIRIDPEIERRVVEIIQKEGGHDVLAAHERAIMEDAERYDAVAKARQAEPGDTAIPGWDVPDDAGAAPAGGGAAALDRWPAGRAGSGPGRDAGLQSRDAGERDRAQAPPELARQTEPGGNLGQDAAWRQLAARAPEFDNPDIIAASKAADAVKPPPTRLDERVTASEKAEAFAKQMYDMFAHRLPEEDRVRLDDLIKRIEDDHEAREIAIVRGGSCLFGVV